MSVAIQCGDGPLREKIRSGNWGHMESLLPFTDELLREEKIKITDIDTFLINRGPGSFTGLRIGFSILRGLLAAGSCSSFGCDSLEALAERIPANQSSNLAVCLDAYRSKFYVKIFTSVSGSWVAKTDSQALEIPRALEMIPPKAIITGDALTRHLAAFESMKNKNFQFAPEDLWFPRAGALIHLYKKHPEKMKKLVSSSDFLPVYLRLSEPEERKLESK